MREKTTGNMMAQEKNKKMNTADTSGSSKLIDADTKSKTKQHRFKISDLVEHTGVGREAIRFYISEGLLPAPSKTSRNMAWYSERHIELLKQIKTLQQDQFLPLKAIKSILFDTPEYKFTGGQVQFIAELKEQLSHPHPPIKKLRMDDVELQRNISKKDLKELQQLGWTTSSKGPFSSQDRKIINLWATFIGSGLDHVPGISPAKMNFILEAADFVLEKNIEIYRHYMRTNLSNEAAAAIVTNSHPVLTQLFASLYERRLKKFAERFSSKPPSAEGSVVKKK